MADFDQFTSAEQPPQEEDPAAEFLKREQEELAGLDDDNFVLETEDAGIYENLGEMPDLGGDAFTAAPPPEFQTQPPITDADFDPYGAELSGADLVDADHVDFDYNSTQVTDSDLYSAIKMEDVTREEPERIKRWREEQNERLLKKDVESEEKKEQWQAVAVKELEDWYKHRQEQLDKTKISNRDGEAEFVRERDENIPGHEWERISRLCDFNPKGSRTTKDVSRMRSILLQLKQTPLVKSS